MLSHFSRVWLFATLWTIARQAPLSMESSRQEDWSGLPFRPRGVLPSKGPEPVTPALQADSFPLSPGTTRYELPTYIDDQVQAS